MARLMAVKITAELLQELITVGGWTTFRCVEGLPVGAEFISSYFDVNTQQATLIFEHESFKEVESGSAILNLGIVMESRFVEDSAKKPICPYCNQEMRREEFEDFRGDLIYVWFCGCKKSRPSSIGEENEDGDSD